MGPHVDFPCGDPYRAIRRRSGNGRNARMTSRPDIRTDTLSDGAALLRDPAVAAAILGRARAWLWDAEAGRIVLASAAGIDHYGAPDMGALANRRFDTRRPAMTQLARLGRSLPQDGRPRLSMLRLSAGFGDAPLLCNCRHVGSAHGHLVLVVSDQARSDQARSELPPRDRAARALAGLPDPLVLRAGEEDIYSNAVGENTRGDPDPVWGDAVTVDLPEGAHALAFAMPEDAPPAAAEQAGVPDTLPDPEQDDAESASAEPEPTDAVRPLPETRRFTFLMDGEGRFLEIGAGFAALVGPQAADVVGRAWSDVAAESDIDPDGHLAEALASRDTWSDIQVDWPTDFGETARLRLSALPRFGEGRAFAGFRGFADVVSVSEAEPDTPSRAGDDAEVPDVDPAPPADTGEAETGDADMGDAASNVVPIPTIARSDDMPDETPDDPVEDLADAGPQRVSLAAVQPEADDRPPEAAPHGGALNDRERVAFQAIAEALGARWQGDDITQPDPVGAAPEPASVPDDGTREADRDTETAIRPAPQTGETADDIVMRSILDRLPVGLAILRDERVLAANRAFCDLFGYDDLDDVTAAGGLGVILEGRDEGRNEGAEPDTVDDAPTVTARCKDGSKIAVHARLGRTPWLDGPAMLLSVREAAVRMEDEPETVAEAASVVGATPDPDAQADLADLSETTLRRILDTALDGVLLIDGEGRIAFANEKAGLLFGCAARELENTDLLERIDGSDRDVVADRLRDLVDGVPSLHDTGPEVAILRDTGAVPAELSPVELSMARIGDGEPAHFSAVFRDLRGWKETEADLIAARKRAEDASEQKSGFLAKMSHEIRTPLNGIIGFSEVMQEERFGPLGNDRYRDYVKDIRESGAHLMGLVNDLLDLSKVEAGKLDMNFSDVRLNDLVEQCVAIMQPQSSDARIVIRSSLARALPAVVADPRSLRQVLLNLLSNAIKFTAAGGQVIVSTAKGRTGEVFLRVRDTGAGMSKADVAVALEPFRQLSVTPSTGERGTGLGLPLAKALVEANRAVFSLESTPGEGTMVEIRFPQSRVLAE